MKGVPSRYDQRLGLERGRGGTVIDGYFLAGGPNMLVFG